MVTVGWMLRERLERELDARRGQTVVAEQQEVN
jgi:hypothetical protein